MNLFSFLMKKCSGGVKIHPVERNVASKSGTRAETMIPKSGMRVRLTTRKASGCRPRDGGGQYREISIPQMHFNQNETIAEVVPFYTFEAPSSSGNSWRRA